MLADRNAKPRNEISEAVEPYPHSIKYSKNPLGTQEQILPTLIPGSAKAQFLPPKIQGITLKSARAVIPDQGAELQHLASLLGANRAR